MLRLALIPAFVLAVLLTALPAATAPPGAQAAAEEEAVYRITLTNISSAQPLSPPLLATHVPDFSLITEGAIASDGLRILAEEGDNGILANELRGNPDVHDIVAATQPMRRLTGDGPPGSASSFVFTIHGRPGDVLSIASMLICTDDGFTGAMNVTLPEQGDVVVLRPLIFDAGTERNTERSSDLTDVCGTMGAQQLSTSDGNARVPTAEPISLHRGLNGLGDLTQASAWSGPVLQIAIERTGDGNDVVGAAVSNPYDEVEPPTNGIATTSGANGNTSTDPGEAPE